MPSVMEQQEELHQFRISARRFVQLKIMVREILGFYLFDIKVAQGRPILDDIAVYLMDHDNFLVWSTQQQMGGGVGYVTQVTQAPAFSTIISAKLNWGCLSFGPQAAGTYHLVLDNSHSAITAKDVVIRKYWVDLESPMRKAVRNALQERRWDTIWDLFEEADNDLQANRLPGCCDYLRKAIVTLWKEVCESLSGKRITFDSGKSADIGILQRLSEPYAPDYVLALVRSTWSLASELAHVEKRGGTGPPVDQVVLAHRLTYSTCAFLVTLVARYE